MSYGIGTEWINAYNNMNALTHEHEDAGGFYDELRVHDGATGLFNWGDGNAFEDDFKANSRGGHADQWVERADIVYFTGHGSPSGFYFRSDVPDDSHVRGDFTSTSAGNDGDLRLGHGDLEWLGLEVCNTLQMDAFQQGANRDVFDRWADAFEGLHALLSFTTTSLDLANPGRAFASALDGRWLTVMVRLPGVAGRPPPDAGGRRVVLDGRDHAAQRGGVGGPLRQQRRHQHRRGLPARPRLRQLRPAARRLLVLLDLDPARLLSARTLPEGTVMTTISVARVRPAALDDDRLRVARRGVPHRR